MILSRYIAMRYLRSFGIVTLGFTAILFFVDLVEQMRRFAEARVSVFHAAGLSLLQIPDGFYGLLPMVALLGGIALFLSLSRSSEMVAIRAVGRSALRFLVAPLLMAAIVGALGVAIINPLVAATTQRYALEAERLGGPTQTVSLGEGAVWLRQSLGEGGQVVIRATRASPDATTLYDASFLIFDPVEGPIRRVVAAQAQLAPGAWALTGVKSWSLTDTNPEASAVTAPAQRLESDLTPARIRDGFGVPEAVPIWRLPSFISGLQRAGFSARRHEVRLQAELARPALLAAMVLLAAAFTLHHMRGRRTGLLALLAFGAGLGLYFLSYFAQVLGDNGDIPPWVAAWAPPAIGALAALGRLLRLEDG